MMWHPGHSHRLDKFEESLSDLLDRKPEKPGSPEDSKPPSGGGDGGVR